MSGSSKDEAVRRVAANLNRSVKPVATNLNRAVREATKKKP